MFLGITFPCLYLQRNPLQIEVGSLQLLDIFAFAILYSIDASSNEFHSLTNLPSKSYCSTCNLRSFLNLLAFSEKALYNNKIVQVP